MKGTHSCVWTAPAHETVRPDRKKWSYHFPALYIILYAALSGSAIPARKAAKAGFNIHTTDGKLFCLNVLNPLLHTIQKRGRKSVGIAASPFLSDFHLFVPLIKISILLKK